MPGVLDIKDATSETTVTGVYDLLNNSKVWINGGFVGRALKSEIWQRNMHAQKASDLPQVDIDWYNNGATFPDRQGKSHIYIYVCVSVTLCSAV